MALMQGLQLDVGPLWGEVATDVQRANARAFLQPGDGDPRLHWYECPKGYSKSTDSAALAIVWLLTQAAEMDEGIVAASDEDQANRLLDKARGLVARSGLADLIKVEAKRIVHAATGAKVVAIAADAAGSEGLLAPLYLVDELPRWKATKTARDMWVTLVSGVPKVPGARLIVLGHAGDPAHWSYPIRERARKSLRWRFTTTPGPTPWLDPDDVDEQRELLLPSQFAQRYENTWTAGEDRLANRDDIAACVGAYDVLEPVRGVSYATGLDIGLTNDRSVATVAHRDASGVVVVDRQQVWAGSKDNPVDLGVVEEWLRQAHADYGGRVVADPYQSVHMAQRLRTARVPVTEFAFTAQSVGRLAVSLFRLIQDRRLLLPADDDLVDELANARLRQTSPGVFRIDHDQGEHDDRVISLALAAHTLTAHDMTTRIHNPANVKLENGPTVPRRGFGSPATSGSSETADPAQATAEQVMSEFGKQLSGGLPEVRERGSLVATRRDPRQAGSRPGWGKNRR